MTHYPAHSRIYHIKADSLDTPTTQGDKDCSTYNNKKDATTESSNVLSGLLAHYDSDNEQEEINGEKCNKLDAKVDDFLQEINSLSETKEELKPCAWQECFDETSGYPYYWNLTTNQVTWEIPEEYKIWLTKNTINKTKQLEKNQQQKSVNIDGGEQKKTLVSDEVNEKKLPKYSNKLKNVDKRSNSDSEDEKIVMITSFSGDSTSDSETEVEKKTSQNVKPLQVMGPHIEDIPKDNFPNVSSSTELNKKEIIENVKEVKVDETVILSRLRTQAKVMQELGEDVAKLDRKTSSKLPSLSLVAGYGDDSDQEQEDDEIKEKKPLKSIFPIPTENPPILVEQSQSTLFPVTKPIDVKQFELPVASNKTIISSIEKPSETESAAAVVDNKIFKRKKRLGVAFEMPPVQEKKIRENFSSEFGGERRKGFGFAENSESSDSDNKIAFKKGGGIAFVKADTLNPASVASTKAEEKDKETSQDEIGEDFEEIKGIVSEKVSFLEEGKLPASPVQIMAIQLQTLEAAYKAGGLSQNYLRAWLRETFTELGKLEQEAAPVGWQCQWDRSNRRYFYRNVQTGETQWDFPEPDIVGGGEAMDICTTPPPNDDEQPSTIDVTVVATTTTAATTLTNATAAIATTAITMNIGTTTTTAATMDLIAPSPPSIRGQSATPPPPPPPKITYTEKREHQSSVVSLSVDVIPPPPPTISVSDNQPLPPGVDSPVDLPFFAGGGGGGSNKSNEETERISSQCDDGKKKDALLHTELDSFYSDIAMLEATNASTTSHTTIDHAKTEIDSIPSSPSSINENCLANDGVAKKKKKNKPKLGQGINMKKKAVSTLVEKWKKVQNDYL